MRKIISYIMLCCFFVSCKSSDNSDKDSLFGSVSIMNNLRETCNLSDVFGDNYRVVKLTTKRKGDIVSPRKLIKANNCFYALSGDNIYVFDNFGEELSLLSKRGMSNDEYVNVDDFDIIDNDGAIGLVVCSQNKLLFYYSDMGEWKIRNSLNFDGVIFDKIKVFNQHIIAKIRGEKSLMITDLDGNVKSKFYDIDRNNIASKSVQFNIIDSCCIYQNGATNSCVVIDKTLTHNIQNIVNSDDRVLTTEITDDIYKSNSNNDAFTIAIRDYFNLSSFKQVVDRSYLVYMNDSFRKRYLVVLEGGDCNSYCFYGDNVTLKDDILGSDNLSYLASIILTDSHNSIIFNVEAANIQGKTIKCNTKEGYLNHKVGGNDNDFLIEFLQ